jgi:hypothetical protein
MDAWEGAFGWQGYALEGRPDILNYLRRGDVSWRQVWDLYGARPAPPDAMLRISGLFHASLSAEFDGAGCHLDPDGEIRRQLRDWAVFAVGAALPETGLQETLARLADSGLITALYYPVAYAAYMEALLDRYAAGWGDERNGPAEGGEPVTAHADGAGCSLPRYYPERLRFPDLQGDARWERSMGAFLAVHHCGWSRAYAALYPAADEEGFLEETGGEG